MSWHSYLKNMRAAPDSRPMVRVQARTISCQCIMSILRVDDLGGLDVNIRIPPSPEVPILTNQMVRLRSHLSPSPSLYIRSFISL